MRHPLSCSHADSHVVPTIEPYCGNIHKHHAVFDCRCMFCELIKSKYANQSPPLTIKKQQCPIVSGSRPRCVCVPEWTSQTTTVRSFLETATFRHKVSCSFFMGFFVCARIRNSDEMGEFRKGAGNALCPQRDRNAGLYVCVCVSLCPCF